MGLKYHSADQTLDIPLIITKIDLFKWQKLLNHLTVEIDIIIPINGIIESIYNH